MNLGQNLKIISLRDQAIHDSSHVPSKNLKNVPIMLVELLLEKVQNLCSFFQIIGRMARAPIFVWGIQTLATRELVKRSTFIKSAKIILVFPPGFFQIILKIMLAQ